MTRPVAAAVIASLLVLSIDAPAEPAEGPRVGIVYTAPIPVINEIIHGFKDTVRQAYPNVRFIERHASGNTAEYGTAVLGVLAQHPVLLAPITTPISKIAVEQARGKVPVVFMGVTDPLGAGIVDSLATPRRSTGSSDLCPFEELLKLTRELLPNAKSLAVPYNPTDEPAVFGISRFQTLAPRFGFSIAARQVTSRDELATEVRGVSSRADAVLLGPDNLMMENPELVAEAAASEGRPLLACDAASVEKGAVAGVSVQYRDVGRAAGDLAVKVLGGSDPGALPVAVLSSGRVLVNKKAACQLKLELPPSLLSRATLINADYVCSPLLQRRTTFLWLLVVTALLVGVILGVRWFRRRSASNQL